MTQLRDPLNKEVTWPAFGTRGKGVVSSTESDPGRVGKDTARPEQRFVVQTRRTSIARDLALARRGGWVLWGGLLLVGVLPYCVVFFFGVFLCGVWRGGGGVLGWGKVILVLFVN